MITKTALLEKIVEGGIIAVIRRPPEEIVDAVAEGLVAGGVTALEVTVDSNNAFSLIKMLAQKLEGRAVVGAGTVIDAMSARLAILNGANFIFSPSLHEEVIRTANRYGKIAVPGVLTPTEIVRALKLGADMVKIFPAGDFGYRYIKDLKGPFPYVPFVPTGGVTLDNVGCFIKVGSDAVGLGSNLVDYSLVKGADASALTAMALKFTTAIKEARKND